jgi:tetratricopeptide (TPR) repeat protein
MFEIIGRAMKRDESRRDQAKPDASPPHPESRRSTSGSLIVIALVAALLAAHPVHAASKHPELRAASDAVVADAEDLIKQAGAANPVDSAKINRAVALLKQALAVDPSNDSAYADLGFCYSVLRDPVGAVHMYSRAVEQNPSAANYKELADIYLRTGDSGGALMAANAGIAKEPRNAKLYNAKGLALHDLQRWEEAADAFHKALDLDPNLEIARRNLEALDQAPSGRGSVAKKAATH